MVLLNSNAILPGVDIGIHASLRSGELTVLDVNPPLPMAMSFGIVRYADRTLVPAAEQTTMVHSLFAATRAEMAQQPGLGAAYANSAGDWGGERPLSGGVPTLQCRRGSAGQRLKMAELRRTI
jgi:hypothetical protein